jgi:hypothetical protein
LGSVGVNYTLTMTSAAPATADPASLARFVEKWAGAELSERAASHEHFIDLRLVGHPTPATVDPTAAHDTSEALINWRRSGGGFAAWRWSAYNAHLGGPEH